MQKTRKIVEPQNWTWEPLLGTLRKKFTPRFPFWYLWLLNIAVYISFAANPFAKAKEKTKAELRAGGRIGSSVSRWVSLRAAPLKHGRGWGFIHPRGGGVYLRDAGTADVHVLSWEVTFAASHQELQLGFNSWRRTLGVSLRRAGNYRYSSHLIRKNNNTN